MGRVGSGQHPTWLKLAGHRLIRPDTVFWPSPSLTWSNLARSEETGLPLKRRRAGPNKGCVARAVSKMGHRKCPSTLLTRHYCSWPMSRWEELTDLSSLLNESWKWVIQKRRRLEREWIEPQAATANWPSADGHYIIRWRWLLRMLSQYSTVKVRCIFVHRFSNIRTPKYRLPRIFSLVCKYVLHNMELISPNQI